MKDTPQHDQDASPVVREEEEEWLRCRACDRNIARVDDIFGALGGPPVQHFANPDGVFWEVLTVRAAQGVVADASAYTAFSWFPGYTWRMVACGGCRMHLGWKYEGSQVPPVFFGLVRGNLAGSR